MARPRHARPHPLRLQATWAALLSSLAIILGQWGVDAELVNQLNATIGQIIAILVALGLMVPATESQVTPTSSPRDNNGRRLVPEVVAPSTVTWSEPPATLLWSDSDAGGQDSGQDSGPEPPDPDVGHESASEPLDTGAIAEVPEDQRLDEDGGPGSDASEGGLDDEDLDELYENPGVPVDRDLV